VEFSATGKSIPPVPPLWVTIPEGAKGEKELLEQMYAEAAYVVENPPPLLAFTVVTPSADLLPNTEFELEVEVSNDGETVARQLVLQLTAEVWFAPSQMLRLGDLEPRKTVVARMNMSTRYASNLVADDPSRYVPLLEARWKDAAGKEYGPRGIHVGIANVRPFLETVVSIKETSSGYRISTWIKNTGFAEAVNTSLILDISSTVTMKTISVSQSSVVIGSRAISWDTGNIGPGQTVGPFGIHSRSKLHTLKGLEKKWLLAALESYTTTKPATIT